MGVEWEISAGATRYGNKNAFDAVSLYYGPKGVGHEQAIIDRFNKDLGHLMYEWKIMYNNKINNK